jgi:hypothetical protein
VTDETVVSAFERLQRRIISMSPAYRAHPLAQAIEEVARIFGPEVTAAALLAAVEAASVRSTTPSRSFRRKRWTTLAVIAFAALAGAVVLGGGREARDDAALLSAPANAAPSSAAPASAVEPAIAVAAPAVPEPERVIEADVAPPSKSQRAMDATTTTTTLGTAEPTGQSTSTLKERRKASRERASRDDRRNAPRRVGFTDAYAAQTTKTKKATTVAQTQNAPAPAKDPNCKVLLPDNVFMSHHDQFRCFR